ncbi:MAG TPA: hypothetical protein VM013_01190 [Dehalococcoidia bacterium]|nr:hypothetical protein [Dehalococcoidia bacterium]
MPKIDAAETMTRELTDVMSRISEYSKRASARREAYSNSNFADMPAWDRMLIEMVIDTHARMDALRAELAELRDLFTPAPENFEE